jgi:hypothetical protein
MKPYHITSVAGKRRKRAPLLLLALGVACSRPVAETLTAALLDSNGTPIRDTAAFFQTDSLQYKLDTNSVGWQTTIGVLFTNRSSETAYFVNCNGETRIGMEKLNGSTWTLVWSPPQFACLSPPIVVKPNERHRSLIYVFGVSPESNGVPKFSTNDLDGTFRLVWNALLSSYQTQLPFGTPFPLERRVSNSFKLTATRR